MAERTTTASSFWTSEMPNHLSCWGFSQWSQLSDRDSRCFYPAKPTTVISDTGTSIFRHACLLSVPATFIGTFCAGSREFDDCLRDLATAVHRHWNIVFWSHLFCGWLFSRFWMALDVGTVGHSRILLCNWYCRILFCFWVARWSWKVAKITE